MAAGRLPMPGSEYGPCQSPQCGHKDCSETRSLAKLKCRYCKKSIGFERRFYFLPSKVSTRGELVHAVCYEEHVEKTAANVESN
jgi:hypothetical protein